jgi:hypothetical protein
MRRFALLLVLALPISLAAQNSRPLPPNENVKVLTELQGQPLRAEMKLIAAALGVDCDHCHVQGNFPSDEKLPKRTARRMIEMPSRSPSTRSRRASQSSAASPATPATRARRPRSRPPPHFRLAR